MAVYVLPTVLAAGLAALFLVPLFAILHWDNRRDDQEWKRLEIHQEEEKPPRWHAAFRELIAATENWHKHRGPVPAIVVLRVWVTVLAWVTAQAAPRPLYDEAAWAAYAALAEEVA